MSRKRLGRSRRSAARTCPKIPGPRRPSLEASDDPALFASLELGEDVPLRRKMKVEGAPRDVGSGRNRADIGGPEPGPGDLVDGRLVHPLTGLAALELATGRRLRCGRRPGHVGEVEISLTLVNDVRQSARD
jgi:hypothetical protein